MEDQEPTTPNELVSWRKTAKDLVRPVPYDLPGGGFDNEALGKINYFKLILRRKYWILAASVLGLIAGFCWVVLQMTVYRSAATVEIVGFNESFMGMNQFDPQAGTGAYGPNSTNLQTQMQILSSPSLLSSVADRVTLEQIPLSPSSGNLYAKIRNRLGLIPQEPTEFTQLAIHVAAATTAARAIAGSRVIEISSQSPSPDVAAAFANALAQEYISQTSRFRASAAARTTQWLEGQIEEATARMQRADEKLQDFVKHEGLAFVLDQNTLADSKLRQLQSDLSAVQTDRINKQARFELAKSSPVDSLPEILDDGTLRGLRDHLTELRKERAQLTATLMPGHVKVRRVDAEIAELEKTTLTEKANLLRRIQNEYEAALRREKLLAGSYAAQSNALAGQAEKAVRYNQLKREGEMARQSHDLLLQQYNQSAIVAAVPASNLRIIDSAGPSSIPYKPEPTKDLSIASGLGAALAAGIIVLLEKIRMNKLTRMYATPGHTSATLNLPELGVIPAFDSRPARLYRLSSRGLERSQSGRSNNPATGLAAWSTPSHVTESFRQTLASLLARQTDQQHSLLVITSAAPEEGKTTLIGNLAAATAETGRRVLVIDGDLRRPRLHKIFDQELGLGFSDLLQSEIPVSAINLEEFIRPTKVEGVSLLSSGSAKTVSVGAMLFSLKLAPLFARLREEFDFVLVDTSPALMFSDTRLLSRLCDGAILVIRSGFTSRENVMTLVQRFAQDGIPICGTILNYWDPAESKATRDLYRQSYEGYSSQT